MQFSVLCSLLNIYDVIFLALALAPIQHTCSNSYKNNYCYCKMQLDILSRVFRFFFFGWLVYLECGAQVISLELLAIHKIQSRDICHLKSIFLFASQTHTHTVAWHKKQFHIVILFRFCFCLLFRRPCDVRTLQTEQKTRKSSERKREREKNPDKLLQIKGAPSNKSRGRRKLRKEFRKIRIRELDIGQKG